MRTAIYVRARCSSDEEREESIKTQISSCLRYAELKNFIVDPDHIYIELETLGIQRERIGLKNLLQASRGRLFDTIVVDDMSRLSRNVTSMQTYLQEFTYMGVSLHAVTDNVDTSNEGTKLMYQLKAIIDDAYINDIRKNTLRGQLEQKERGFFMNEQAFGYKSKQAGDVIIGRNGKSRPERYMMYIDSHEAAIVERIFQMYANGKSVSKIVKQLNIERVPSRKSAENGWSHSTVKRILTNEKYIGIWTWGNLQNKRNSVTGAIKKVPRPDGPLHKAIHNDLRIVSQELWEQVQARIKDFKKTWPGGKDRTGL